MMTNDFVVISKYPMLFKRIERALLVDDDGCVFTMGEFNRRWVVLKNELDNINSSHVSSEYMHNAAIEIITLLIQLMTENHRQPLRPSLKTPTTAPRFAIGDVVRSADDSPKNAWRISSIAPVGLQSDAFTGGFRYYGHHLITGLLQAGFERDVVLCEQQAASASMCD